MAAAPTGCSDDCPAPAGWHDPHVHQGAHGQRASEARGNDCREHPSSSSDHCEPPLLIVFVDSQIERAWRAKWLHDQELSPREPVYVPEYWKERINPIRRLTMLPLNAVFKPLEGVLVSRVEVELEGP